jgi:PBP1b-binding outer membrane lipoprotein LpoB
MRKSLMVLLSILILAGCASNIPTVVPSVEKYCPRPVRPVIAQKDIWTMQELLQLNLTVIDYTLKLEASLECWESKPAKNK